jgi:hypothetical protein
LRCDAHSQAQGHGAASGLDSGAGHLRCTDVGTALAIDSPDWPVDLRFVDVPSNASLDGEGCAVLVHEAPVSA